MSFSPPNRVSFFDRGFAPSRNRKMATHHPMHKAPDSNIIAILQEERFAPTTWIDPEYRGVPANFIHRSVEAPLDEQEQAYLDYLLAKSAKDMGEHSFRWHMAMTWSYRRRIYELEQLVNNSEQTGPQEALRPATANELFGDILLRRHSRDACRSSRSASPVQRDIATSTPVGFSKKGVSKNTSTAEGNYGSSEEDDAILNSSIPKDVDVPQPSSPTVGPHKSSTPRFVVKASGSPLLVAKKDDEEKPFKSWADLIDSSSSSEDRAMSLSALPSLTSDIGSDKSLGAVNREISKLDGEIAALCKRIAEDCTTTCDDIKLPNTVGEQRKPPTDKGKSPAAPDRWELHPKEHFEQAKRTEVVASRRRPVPKTEKGPATPTRKAHVPPHLRVSENTEQAGDDKENEDVYISSKRHDDEDGWVKPPPDVSPVRIDPRIERNTFGSFYDRPGMYMEPRPPAPIFVKADNEKPASNIADELVHVVPRKLKYQRLAFTYKHRAERIEALKNWRLDRFSEFLASRHQDPEYQGYTIEELILLHPYGPKVMLPDDWLARIAKMLYKYEMNTMEDLQLLLKTGYDITHCDSLIDNLHCLRATGRLLYNDDRRKNLGGLPREQVRKMINDLLDLELDLTKED